MEDTLQDALKAQPSLLPQRKAVERLCITSYKMMVQVILSSSPPPQSPGVKILLLNISHIQGKYTSNEISYMRHEVMN